MPEGRPGRDGHTAGDSRRVALIAARSADAKLATDVVVLDVGDVLGITDHFVIASGANDRQVRTIAEEVEERLAADADRKPLRSEGLSELRWVLLDYGDVVVHVFHTDTRAFYDLERLWRDVPRLDWTVDADGPSTRSAAGE